MGYGGRENQRVFTVPTSAKVFCAVYDDVGKADLRKGCWNPIGGNSAFFKDN